MRQVSNRCKRVLESTKHSYVEKTKESIISQKLGSHDFWRIANSVLSVSKSVIPHLFNGHVVLSSASIKQNILLIFFSKKSNLDESLEKSYLVFHLELTWNWTISFFILRCLRRPFLVYIFLKYQVLMEFL